MVFPAAKKRKLFPRLWFPRQTRVTMKNSRLLAALKAMLETTMLEQPREGGSHPLLLPVPVVVEGQVRPKVARGLGQDPVQDPVQVRGPDLDQDQSRDRGPDRGRGQSPDLGPGLGLDQQLQIEAERPRKAVGDPVRVRQAQLDRQPQDESRVAVVDRLDLDPVHQGRGVRQGQNQAAEVRGLLRQLARNNYILVKNMIELNRIKMVSTLY